jgi:hypothetical protein
LNLELPENLESISINSSGAKIAKQEIEEYLNDKNTTANDILMHTLKTKFYSGDSISPEFLKNFSEVEKFDCKFLK